ncbi:methionyl-tRNA formyltransferase [Bifidobacterium jacchi]|uniref:Methionyl-tRNA formyltransferase n=1 Tax=Bifidobacterium jacchi TaxID=2490545 RepID=A0A5N5RLA2_9BIFI|nr:methionyl-tRNA formyltransferase [Bifidobacterium jacchi]KAB5607551.1 methionyl-tRNA formyltransferase [Bifidobacterium jacchi]
MLKLLFAGTPDVAVPSLRALAADAQHVEVVAVLTRPDAPVGRGRRLMPSPVKQAALELGLPVIESDPGEPAFISELAATGAQAAAVVAYGRILKQNVLDALPGGWYNLHFSLLPRWRGAAPVQRSIWAGDAQTGTTVFRITRQMDSGPIIRQTASPIGVEETSGDLFDRLAVSGAADLVAAMRAVGDGTAVERPQPRQTDEPIADKIRVDDAHIDVQTCAAGIDRQIRACTPHPGAWLTLHANGASGDALGDGASGGASITLHVIKARPVAAVAADSAAGGEVSDRSGAQVPTELAAGALVVGKRNVWLGTGDGVLELLEVKAQGKKAMRAADWARGAHLAADAYCD